jgi:hypothetical protein
MRRVASNPSHQIWTQRCRLLDRLQAIPGLPDNLEIGLGVEQPGQSLAEQQMVVHQQNPQRVHRLLLYPLLALRQQRLLVTLHY